MEDDAELASPGTTLDLPQVDAVDLDRALERFVEAGDKLRRVDLPPPDSPTSATHQPFGTSMEMPSMTGSSP